MNSAVREYAVDTVDALAVYGSYKQSGTAGNLSMRAHFREVLVSRQDSTGEYDDLYWVRRAMDGVIRKDYYLIGEDERIQTLFGSSRLYFLRKILVIRLSVWASEPLPCRATAPRMLRRAR